MTEGTAIAHELMPLATQDQTRLVALVAKNESVVEQSWMFFPAQDLVKGNVVTIKDSVFRAGLMFEEYMIGQAMAEAHLTYRRRVKATQDVIERVAVTAPELVELFQKLENEVDKVTLLFRQLVDVMGDLASLEEDYKRLEGLVDELGKIEDTSCG